MQRRMHALAALGDRLVGEADDVEDRLSRRHQHLDVDGNRLDPLKRDGGDARDHVGAPEPETLPGATAAVKNEEERLGVRRLRAALP